MKYHTLSVLVANRPGVLTRVAALFSRRGYNIESLAVGPTEKPDISRMTVVAAVSDEAVLEQLVKQLHKLVEVLKIIELEANAVQRELVLIKVRADAETRGKILELVGLFRGKAVDVSHNSITVEVTGSPEKVEALFHMLEAYGVTELAQSGLVALGRGGKALTDRRGGDQTRK